jgi:hypothetical protein
MWRSLLAVCLLVVAGVFTVTGVANAVAQSDQVVAAQPSESVDPGPDINAPQEQDNPGIAAETRKKLWIGGIALVLFALVYWRNKKRWAKWRKAKKG